VAGKVFSGVCRLSAVRKANPAFGGQLLTVTGNFSDKPVELPAETVSVLLAGRTGTDLLAAAW
jgi:hypothetical protein